MVGDAYFEEIGSKLIKKDTIKRDIGYYHVRLYEHCKGYNTHDSDFWTQAHWDGKLWTLDKKSYNDSYFKEISKACTSKEIESDMNVVNRPIGFYNVQIPHSNKKGTATVGIWDKASWNGKTWMYKGRMYEDGYFKKIGKQVKDSLKKEPKKVRVSGTYKVKFKNDQDNFGVVEDVASWDDNAKVWLYYGQYYSDSFFGSIGELVSENHSKSKKKDRQIDRRIGWYSVAVKENEVTILTKAYWTGNAWLYKKMKRPKTFFAEIHQKIEMEGV